MPVNIEPTFEVPMPDNLQMQDKSDFIQKAKVAGNTATLLSELGATFEMTAEDEAAAASLFTQLHKKKESPEKETQLTNPAIAYKLGTYINEYERNIVQDKLQLRTVVTNRLLEISESDDDKVALKALELLGKASDLFTERSEITITHKNSDELRDAIKDRIRTLMQMNTIDITPKAERLANGLDDGKNPEIIDV